VSDTPTLPGLSSVTTDEGLRVTSTSETPEQITEALKDPISEAAATLGKKGGEAAAAKRREAKDAGHIRTGETGEQLPEPVQPDGGEDSVPDGDGQGGKGEHQSKPLGKPRDDPRARMLEATRKEAEAKRERDAIKAERDRLAAELAEARAGKAPDQPKKPAGDEDPEPQEGDYEDWTKWLKDHTRWDARQELRTHQQELARQEAAQSYQRGIDEAVSTFGQRVGEAFKADPTLAERTAAVAAELRPSFRRPEGTPLTAMHVVADEVILSEHAPALMLHFAEHPEELQRVSSLRTPFDIQRAIALLEGRLSAVPVAPAPKPAVSQAKPPVRPVNGSPHTSEGVPDEKASYEQHRAYWLKKDREKAASR
jgi:hypothetical protein